ncbi:MAG: hypothetical protein L0Y73_04640, partial [Candidatus Aminicenantes bacterium]|nr:hypothetical protein [Candidatus Aminicenantes bacterium]
YVYGNYLEEPNKFIVKVFNKKLEYISQKIFHVGQGPGDVAALNIITPIDDKIYIAGNSNQQVGIFNSDLEYIDCIKFNWEKVGGPFPLSDDGRYFIGKQYLIDGKNALTKFKLVSFPALEGKVFLEHSMIPPAFNDRILKLDSMPGISYFFKDKSVYFLYMNEYRLLKLNLNGDKLRDVVVKVDRVKISEDKKKLYLEEYSRLQGNVLKLALSDYVMPAGHIVALGNGFIVVRRQDYGTECSGMTTGDYFNYRIEYLGKVKIPCFYQLYLLIGPLFLSTHRYADGFLYLVNEIDEELWLEKWLVKE